MSQQHEERPDAPGTESETADDRAVSRRSFVRRSALSGAAVLVGSRIRVGEDRSRVGRLPGAEGRATGAAAPAPFELEEATIADLQSGMASGKYTARSLVDMYSARIAAMDRTGLALRAVLEVNPDAQAIADQLDAERRAGKVRGPMHGIPVLIKDNIATADRMQTTAGSLALLDAKPPRDSFVAAQLRAAGAVILGKTNLSEWANFRSSHSSSGWSGRGGQARNPYALDRTPSGSSSGSGVGAASSYCAVAIGTETDGSITSPSAASSLVGIKPTVGLVSRSGIVPISHSQDTAGPMCRTVRDAAILLGALTGVDAGDAATAASRGKSYTDYTRFLDAGGLKGARVGIPRKRYTGYSAKTDAILAEVIDVLKKAGATVVDPADIPTAGKFGGAEYTVLLYEFKADLNRYLAEWAPTARVKTLQDIIAFDEAHAAEEMPYFGQEIMLKAQAKGPLTSKEYLTAAAKAHRMSRQEGIDAVMDRYKLDALVAPTQGPVWQIDLVNGDSGSGGSATEPAAVAGYPHITVPAGYVFGLPVGVSFFGRAWSEPTLLRLAYAYEQATKVRQAPRYLPTADIGVPGGTLG